MLTGSRWEQIFTRHLFDEGWWVLNIPKKVNGQQPFDIIAVKGSSVLAADCKVCSSDRFQLSRIEPNQWTAFALMLKRTDARCGFAIIQSDSMQEFWLDYLEAVQLAKEGKASIKLSEEYKI